MEISFRSLEERDESSKAPLVERVYDKVYDTFFAIGERLVPLYQKRPSLFLGVSLLFQLSYFLMACVGVVSTLCWLF